MEMGKENTHPHSITAYDENTITVANNKHSHTLLVSADHLEQLDSITDLSDLDSPIITKLAASQPEVLLIGTGRSTRFLSSEQLVSFSQRGVGVECMRTDAACRTFNILLHEGRKVSALLLIG